ncbi:MAG: TIGR04086 family membrane protein [Dethiobacteria bacterium]|nr:TIGR04086 family membrane protein [Bacillota bacterium]
MLGIVRRPSGRRLVKEDTPPLFVVAKGVIYGLFISLLLLIIISLLINFTALSETLAPYLIFVASLIGILSGSAFVGRRIGEKGWLNGGLTGLTFVVILLAFGFVLEDLTFGLQTITKLFLGFAFGAIGGMIGINA